ncbi:MAG: insulinase family protein [Nanoarchaeota archaeon]
MNKLKINQEYHGFILKKIEKIEDINSLTYIFEHKETKAKVLNILNDDEEKTFAIGFRTPPVDDTGLTHILEHSVLCGSKNFPLKDPFAQLIRSSIHTFLNAFTFPDKTVYPFSTQNEDEYKKMMNVYLDAVFHPLIYEKEEIFLQEGWRYELDKTNKKLKYNGVVYSEMKGATSSPQDILEDTYLEKMFPDNCYKYKSGGDPSSIPDLTYEKFLDFHKTYYHPSNSYIYIYGNTDILNHLKYIQENYLKNYKYKKINSTINYQKTINKPINAIQEYSVSTNNIKNKYYHHINTLICKNIDNQLCIAFDILSDILIGMSGSPLKQALLSANLGEDFTGRFEKNELIQPTFYITIQNSTKENKEKFEKIYFDTLKKLRDKGINKDLINAAINQKEFEYKEATNDNSRFNEGIKYLIDVFGTWLYDEDPIIKLKYKKEMEQIKKLSKDNYFENLIDKYLINNNHRLSLTLKPNPNLNIDKNVNKKLSQTYKRLFKQDIEKIKNQSLKLKEFQEKKEKKEDIEKIKLIDINKIPKEPKKINLEIIEDKNTKEIIYHSNTKGITYLDFLFDARVISKENIQYLSLLEDLLLDVKTKNYSYNDWSNLINVNTGDLDFSLINLIHNKTNNLIPKFKLETKFLNENLNKINHIIEEITNNVQFSSNKIKEILQRIKSTYEIKFIEQGHLIAYLKNQSKVTDFDSYNEKIKGISYYNFICNLLNNFDIKENEIINNIKETYKKIFNKNNLIILITTDLNKNDLLNFKKINIKEEKLEIFNFNFTKNPKNSAFIIPSQISYNCKGYNYKKLGFEYKGEYHVLNNYLRYKYLWENIRMKGGAYGGGGIINRNGTFTIFSYRDPRIKGTYDDYDKIFEHIKKLNLSQKEIKQYIIGSISNFDEPLKPHEEGFKKCLEYIQGITYDDLKKERKELLTANLDKLQKISIIINEVINKQNNYCTIGNENSINKNKKLFDNIQTIIK